MRHIRSIKASKIVAANIVAIQSRNTMKNSRFDVDLNKIVKLDDFSWYLLTFQRITLVVTLFRTDAPYLR